MIERSTKYITSSATYMFRKVDSISTVTVHVQIQCRYLPVFSKPNLQRHSHVQQSQIDWVPPPVLSPLPSLSPIPLYHFLSPSAPFPSLPFSFLPCFLNYPPSLSPSPNLTRGSGERCKLRGGVRGGAPATDPFTTSVDMHFPLSTVKTNPTAYIRMEATENYLTYTQRHAGIIIEDQSRSVRKAGRTIETKLKIRR